MNLLPLLSLTATLSSAPATQGTSVTFPSKDGLMVTADLYAPHSDKKTPFIVLFHQAGWSRGEYLEIAPRLNTLGFNCMAVDQRSGSEVNGERNETHSRARAAGKGIDYVDAIDDMIAALQYAKKHYAGGRLIAWGSSYSAALVLKLAGDRPDLIDAVLSFSPGEYFAKQGKSKHWVRDSAAKIVQPVFITSARSEKKAWGSIFQAIPSKAKHSYLPDSRGNHGSRALWRKFPDSKGYWTAVEKFLSDLQK